MGFKLGKVAGKVGASLLGGAIGGAAGFAAGGSDGFDAGAMRLLGSDVVSGALGIGEDQLAAQQDWEYRKKAADYAYNQNLAMWNLQNAYNDPSAQMARLKAAGLNPNLVYGGGNVTGNSASSGPEYKLSGEGVYQNRSLQRQQLQLAMKDHQQRITNQAIENDLARQRLVLAERDADRQDALAKAQIDAYKANLGFRGAEIENMSYGRERDRRQEAWQRYKHDVDTYDKNAKELKDKYSVGFAKWGLRASFSGSAQRNIVKKLGFRPKYSDYLNGLK